ncbi:MAG: CHAT domain-containing protein [Acidobacteriota bacterium]
MSGRLTSCSESNNFILRGICSTLLTLAFIVLSVSKNSHALSQQDSTLEQGKPVERELAGGQKHLYQITLAEGQYLSVIVEQRGIDVVARLLGPDRKAAFEFDTEIRLEGQEAAEMVAEAAGSYRLEVEGKYRAFPSGRYEIRVVELRAATARDGSLQEARRLLAESRRMTNAGRYEEAQSLAERVFEIREQALGADHSLTAIALHNLAAAHKDRGNYDKSEQLHQQALRIREKVFGPEHPHVAISINALAGVCFSREEYAKALSFYQRALGIYEKTLIEDHPFTANILLNIGMTHNAKGDLLKAEEATLRALAIHQKIAGPEHLNVGITLNTLGLIYDNQGDYEKAGSALQRSIAIIEKSLGPEHARLRDPLNNLANLYFRKGDYAQAEPLYERLIKLVEKTLGPDHPLLASNLYNFASFNRFKGDYAKAEMLYRRALEIRAHAMGSDHPGVGRILEALANLYEAKGHPAEALPLYERAAAITEREINLNLATGSERQKLAYLRLLPEQANVIISLNARNASDISATELAATITLQRKGRVQDAMADSLAALRRRLGAEDQKLLDRLNETTAQLARLVLNGPQRVTLAEHQKQIKALDEQREKLEAEISHRSAGFYEGSHSATLASIRSAIPTDAALIEFAIYQPFDLDARLYDKRLGEPRYVAYTLRSRGEVGMRDLGEAKPIDEAVARLREALRDPKRGDVGRLARAVDEKVMQPLRALIGDASQLLISPDGSLNLIPFAALVDERGQYLLERYSISYLTSGRDLLRLETPRPSGSRALVVADPIFGEPGILAKADAPKRSRSAAGRKRQSVTWGADLSSVYFAPLRGTAEEAQAIRGMFPESTVLTGAKATESALKKVEAPRILHIATHGFFLYETNQTNAGGSRGISANVKIENPLLRSGLALAGANLREGSDDGILTAMEAAGLNLWGTKLVVLSACDTGLGEVINGEGVYGLRRAFALAGAETLVMSLWPVSDYVTREMMTAYYKGLKQGEGRGKALRQVQLAMLRRADRAHPFYWASFIQSGEWASLDGKR